MHCFDNEFRPRAVLIVCGLTFAALSDGWRAARLTFDGVKVESRLSRRGANDLRRLLGFDLFNCADWSSAMSRMNCSMKTDSASSSQRGR